MKKLHVWILFADLSWFSNDFWQLFLCLPSNLMTNPTHPTPATPHPHLPSPAFALHPLWVAKPAMVCTGLGKPCFLINCVFLLCCMLILWSANHYVAFQYFAGNCPWELSLGNFRLGSFPWELSPGNWAPDAHALGNPQCLHVLTSSIFAKRLGQPVVVGHCFQTHSGTWKQIWLHTLLSLGIVCFGKLSQ